MAVRAQILIAFLGITVIACMLASGTAPAWDFAELILLVGGIVLVREYGLVVRHEEMQQVKAPDVQERTARFAATVFGDLPRREAEGRSQGFSPWDVAHEPYEFSAASTGQRPPTVEQMAHEMLSLSCRQASIKYHPDHGGSAESMRRVYAARELLRRGIQRF